MPLRVMIELKVQIFFNFLVFFEFFCNGFYILVRLHSRGAFFQAGPKDIAALKYGCLQQKKTGQTARFFKNGDFIQRRKSS